MLFKLMQKTLNFKSIQSQLVSKIRQIRTKKFLTVINAVTNTNYVIDIFYFL